MPDAPASDTAMQFADYVLENYIAVDSYSIEYSSSKLLNSGSAIYDSDVQLRK